MKHLFLFISVALLLSNTGWSQAHGPAASDTTLRHISPGVREVRINGDTLYRKVVIDSVISSGFLDTLPQPFFWRNLIRLTDDSALMSVPQTRQILDTIAVSVYSSMSDSTKNSYRDSLRRMNGLSDSARIVFTPGKRFFYDFQNALPNIDGSIPVFIENNVDPWYAQSILLIESPNKLQKSYAGAYGPFQLMKYVARKYGLVINKKMDERSNLKRSAYAASMFIKYNCLPTVRSVLDSLQVPYNENELWFRLLVMHVYHAGAGNVQKVLFTIRPTTGGFPLICQVWQTRAGSFGNASQNYSQVLIAALSEFHALLRRESEIVR